MNPVTKQQWIDALRSGKYKKGRVFLKKGHPDQPVYCCIGVFGELAGFGDEKLRQGNQLIYDQATKLAGLTDSTLLTDRNDGHGFWKNSEQTFEQIATFLETGKPKMISNPTPGSCPNCNYLISHATCVERGFENEKPKEGDLTVCIGCGIILEFTSELEHKVVSNEKLNRLASESPSTWDSIKRVRNAILELRLKEEK